MSSLDMFGDGFIQYLIEQQEKRMIGTPMNFAWHRKSAPIPLTGIEIEVLEMCANLRCWPETPQAWVNASIEFLREDGYVTRDLKLTEKGKGVLE